MTIEATTPRIVATIRKTAFSSACPRVGKARIATVSAADDGASSCSQKLVPKQTTIAVQMRTAKAQEPSGNPAKRYWRCIATVLMTPAYASTLPIACPAPIIGIATVLAMIAVVRIAPITRVELESMRAWQLWVS